MSVLFILFRITNPAPMTLADALIQAAKTPPTP